MGQKQKNVFLNNKAALIAGPKAKKIRYVKNVGLGFKTPIEAKEGNYIDKKCPFTGLVQIRGRILNGVVQKLKMQRTVVIRRDYLHFIRKYKRFEKRHKNISAHLSPCFRDIAVGDTVTVGECRPLSKTVRFMGSKSRSGFPSFCAAVLVIKNYASTRKYIVKRFLLFIKIHRFLLGFAYQLVKLL